MAEVCAYCGDDLIIDQHLPTYNLHTRLGIQQGTAVAYVTWCTKCADKMLFDLDVIRRCGGWTAWLDAVKQRGDSRVIEKRLALRPVVAEKYVRTPATATITPGTAP